MNNIIGDNISLILKRKKMSPERLAYESKLKDEHIKAYIAGVKVPQKKTIEIIANTLGVPAIEITHQRDTLLEGDVINVPARETIELKCGLDKYSIEELEEEIKRRKDLKCKALMENFIKAFDELNKEGIQVINEKLGGCITKVLIDDNKLKYNTSIDNKIKMDNRWN